MKRYNFFATPVWHVNILDKKYNDTLKNFILNLSKKQNSVAKTNDGGWQSESNLQNVQIFNKLFNDIENQFKNSELDIQKMIIRQAWANINYKNNLNVIHNHGQYNFAVVYYVDVPEDSGALTIRDPRPGATAFAGNWTDRIYRLYQEKTIMDQYPKAGDLIIFPGFLDHFVRPSKSEDPRISVAIDYDAIYF
jgi:uncharacterized protein (TIGR02466 family)